MKTHPIPALTETDVARFLAKIAGPDENGCRIWTATVTYRGYGQFWLGRKYRLAHRVAYWTAVGPIPEGHEIDHRCHNRACVTPDHLRVATGKQNKENTTGANSNSQSGVRGVYPSVLKDGTVRWVAQVQHNGRILRFGRFDTVEEATESVIAARLSLFTFNDADRVRTE